MEKITDKTELFSIIDFHNTNTEDNIYKTTNDKKEEKINIKLFKNEILVGNNEINFSTLNRKTNNLKKWINFNLNTQSKTSNNNDLNSKKGLIGSASLSKLINCIKIHLNISEIKEISLNILNDSGNKKPNYSIDNVDNINTKINKNDIINIEEILELEEDNEIFKSGQSNKNKEICEKISEKVFDTSENKLSFDNSKLNQNISDKINKSKKKVNNKKSFSKDFTNDISNILNLNIKLGIEKEKNKLLLNKYKLDNNSSNNLYNNCLKGNIISFIYKR